MAKLHQRQVLKAGLRIILFLVVVLLGTSAALVAGEQPGLALADLADTPVQALSRAGQPNVIYAALKAGSQPDGFYRSLDNGRTWENVGAGPGRPVQVLAAHPADGRVLYAGSAGSLWRSEDGGQTWRNFGPALPAGPEGTAPAVTALATDPAQPELLYVGTAGQGVYRFNSGPQAGYAPLSPASLPDAHVRGLVMGPDGQLYALTNGGLYRTDGDTWLKMGKLPGTPVSLAVAPGDARILYAGDASSGVYHSTDGGQSWQPAATGLGLAPGASLRVTALAIDPADPQHVVAATAYSLGRGMAGGGLYESRNGAESWSRLAELDEVVTQLTLNDGTIYAAAADGLKLFGQPPAAVPTTPLANLPSLAHPTLAQLLILILTLTLAGLILLGRLEWLRRQHQKPVSH